MMSSVSELDRLTSTLSYRNPLRTRSDVMNVLKSYRSLNVRRDDFNFSDGTCRKLIVVDGTIPVNYRGALYNIPIALYLKNTHPDNSPICYVRPTPSMEIRVSRYVDSEGKVYLPYLHEWKQSTSDLLSLVQICIIVFGENPPVYAKVQERYPPYPPHSSPSTDLLVNPSTPSGTLNERHVRVSLLSAVQDKLRRHLREEFEVKNGELMSLTRMRDELNRGKHSVDEYLQTSQDNIKFLEKDVALLTNKLNELRETSDKLEHAKDMKLDEAVTATTPLYKQLFDAFAEEASVDDTIYYLGEGLRRGLLDCDTFLKNVRKLSRQQFVLRSLMIKCREKAGLKV